MRRSVRPVQRLSKSQFVSGLQCPKMLWWMVHGQKYHLRGDLNRAIELYTKSLFLSEVKS